jgi:hypothetical protein
MSHGPNRGSIRRESQRGPGLVMALSVVLTLSCLIMPASALGPSLEISSPSSGHVTKASSIDVKGTTNGTSVTVNGVQATLSDSNFTVMTDLNEGANSIMVEASDGGGNRTTKAISVVRDTVPPALSVMEPVMVPGPDPAPVLETGLTTMNVTGIVEKGGTVKVNNIPAIVTGIIYEAQVHIDANTTLLDVTATDKAGNSATVTIPVVFDDELQLNATLDDEYWEKKDKRYLTYYDRTTVIGRADPGTNVTIDHVPIEIEADGSFKVEVLIDEGIQDIVVEAWDGAGNNRTVHIEIERLEWEPFAVPVELAVGLLILGLVLGASGGMVIGRHRERKVRAQREQEALRKAGKGPPTPKEVARAQTDERMRRKELERRQAEARAKEGQRTEGPQGPHPKE